MCLSCTQIRRGRGESGPRRAGALARGAAALPVLLQPVHEPHAVAALRVQALRLRQGEDGGNAAAQHELDRGEGGTGFAIFSTRIFKRGY